MTVTEWKVYWFGTPQDLGLFLSGYDSLSTEFLIENQDSIEEEHLP